MSIKFIHSRVQSNISLLVFCSDQQLLTFLTPGMNFVKDIFPGTRAGSGDGLGVIQVHDLFCVLYFCDYYMSSPSDDQALDSGGCC